MTWPITPTPKLNVKETEEFLKCYCKICTRAKRFLGVIQKLSEEDQCFMKDILKLLYNAEFDVYSLKRRNHETKNIT